jgi:hypothetical protein
MPTFLTNISIKAVPEASDHAVTLGILEAAIGEHYKSAVRAVARTNLAGSYATKALTGSGDLPAVDGISLAVGDRVLLAGQNDDTQNGIYVVSSAVSPWKLVRAPDFQASDQIKAGVKVHVNQGNSLADATFALIGDGPFTLDSTSLEFDIVGGLLAAVAERVFAVVGDASAKAFTFTHGWGTRMVSVEVLDESDWATVVADVTRPTDNTIAITFAAAPTSGRRYSVIARAMVKP